MNTILALVCIILGFIVAIAKVDILFPPLDWFVAALAFEFLALPSFGPFITSRKDPQ